MTPLPAQRPRSDRSFERLYRRHVADVYRYALAICRSAPDAEDVTQTTFRNAYRAIQCGEQPQVPKNWLLTIAHNVMRYRRDDEEPLEDEDEAFSGEDGYSAGDIQRALGELAADQRAVLFLREADGRANAEIAELLDLSVSGVEILLFRARRALRERLESSLTCQGAERAISRQLDGRLTADEKATLHGHLRACADCAAFVRSQHVDRAALRSLAGVPLPASLASPFGAAALGAQPHRRGGLRVVAGAGLAAPPAP